MAKRHLRTAKQVLSGNRRRSIFKYSLYLCKRDSGLRIQVPWARLHLQYQASCQQAPAGCTRACHGSMSCAWHPGLAFASGRRKLRTGRMISIRDFLVQGMNVFQETDWTIPISQRLLTPAVFRETRALRESPAKAYGDLTRKPDRAGNEPDKLGSDYRAVSRPPQGGTGWPPARQTAQSPAGMPAFLSHGCQYTLEDHLGYNIEISI